MRRCPCPPFQGSDWTVHENFAVDLRLFLYHPIIGYCLWHSQWPPYPNWSMLTNLIVIRQRFRHASIPYVMDPFSHPAIDFKIKKISKFKLQITIKNTLFMDVWNWNSIELNWRKSILIPMEMRKAQRNVWTQQALQHFKWKLSNWKCP